MIPCSTMHVSASILHSENLYEFSCERLADFFISFFVYFRYKLCEKGDEIDG